MPIVTAATAVDLFDGKTVVLVLNEAIKLPPGNNSLICPNQVRAFGHKVDDTPCKYGGKQQIETRDVYVIPFFYQSGLLGLEFRTPTKDVLSPCTTIDMTSDLLWNPYSEFDADDWYDTDDSDPFVASNFDVFNAKNTGDDEDANL